MYIYNARLERVVDGDTVDMSIDLGFNVWIKERLRLSRINAPERFTEEGKRAKQFVEEWFDAQIPGTDILRVTVLGKGKYGRWIAEVTGGAEQNLSDILVESENAIYWEY